MTSLSDPRLIEVDFPLEATSLDAVHEKNVRHGHISTLHIWPARRPLAACRAALIATLLPDPGTTEGRHALKERIAGKLVATTKKKLMPNGKTEILEAKESVGGILHWGRESGPDLQWFRDEIRRVWGRAPRVLDPFSGGGAIPLEAMRLGCEATAVDINPVAWFLLKCTLELPQKFAGQEWDLPAFAHSHREFLSDYFEKKNNLRGVNLQKKLASWFGKKAQQAEIFEAHEDSGAATLRGDLAWQVRAWGRWVLDRARQEMADFYPVYAEWEPLLTGEGYRRWEEEYGFDKVSKGLKLCALTSEGRVDEQALNAEFDEDYLRNPENPRWVAKPVVAYLWARTVRNSQYPDTLVPLLKTLWLCKKDDKRVRLELRANLEGTGVDIAVLTDVPKVGGNNAAKREHDRKIGQGTMSRTGVTCPVHNNVISMNYIRHEGQAGRLGQILTAVVVDGPRGKEYRRPTEHEIQRAEDAAAQVESVFADIPFGVPKEPLPSKEALGFRMPLYGFDQWGKLFTSRQLVALGTFVKAVRAAPQAMEKEGLPSDVVLAIWPYLSLAVDRMANRGSTQCIWNMPAEKIEQTFARFALPILWDFAEANSLGDASGNYEGEIEWVHLVIQHLMLAATEAPHVIHGSAKTVECSKLDVVVTDPPYYDAIPYSDLMDFFYVWLRRCLSGHSPEIDKSFSEPLSPKWNPAENDGELIDDSSRFEGNASRSKKNYEDGMARSFELCHQALSEDGRLVIVFAHKQPDAWETLVTAIIRAGFVVDASWPIQTERAGRMRATGSAALSSSVWLVCKKRPATVRPGWDTQVISEMKGRIESRLRDYWDAGIRGPDFVWSATGPAMEAYSRYPVVKKSDVPGELLGVSEFLRMVRRMVLDFVVGQVLSTDTGNESLDDLTSYYLLHRNDFGFSAAPAGACILYAVGCNLTDSQLADRFDILTPVGGRAESEDEDDEAESDEEPVSTGTKSQYKLKAWNQRHRSALGESFDGSDARIPLIDQIHRLMQLWKAGDVIKVDDYLVRRSVRTNQLFPKLLQALIELSEAGSEERSLQESLMNHLRSRQAATPSLNLEGA